MGAMAKMSVPVRAAGQTSTRNLIAFLAYQRCGRVIGSPRVGAQLLRHGEFIGTL